MDILIQEISRMEEQIRMVNQIMVLRVLDIQIINTAIIMVILHHTGLLSPIIKEICKIKALIINTLNLQWAVSFNLKTTPLLALQIQ